MNMKRWVLLLLFTVLAIAAASFGFLGLSTGGSTGRVMIFVFLGLCLAVLVWGIYFGRRPPPIPPNPPIPPV